MTEITDPFNTPIQIPRGSAQCPVCGRFATIVRVVTDAAPLSAEEGYYVVVNCFTHGERIS